MNMPGFNAEASISLSDCGYRSLARICTPPDGVVAALQRGPLPFVDAFRCYNECVNECINYGLDYGYDCAVSCYEGCFLATS